MAMPVGMLTRARGAISTGSSTQAHRSMAAEPGVA